MTNIFFNKYLAKDLKSVSKSIQINAFESQILLMTEIESKNSENRKLIRLKTILFVFKISFKAMI
jgi:hypothetical protein